MEILQQRFLRTASVVSVVEVDKKYKRGTAR